MVAIGARTFLAMLPQLFLAAAVVLPGRSSSLGRVVVPARGSAFPVMISSAVEREPTSEFVTPLYDFTGPALESSISQWERIDDVIMGGISSSRLVAAPDSSCALFEGKLREMGGGFCGQRMRLLAEPLDISNESGLWVDLEADADARSRVYKLALRTRQDRGEVIYQTEFAPPPLSRTRVLLPFSEFKLVRGPRLVPGVPPLAAANASSVFQLSLVLSKFRISTDGAALPNFKEGPFCTKLYGVGVFRSSPTSVAGEVAKPKVMTEEEAQAARPLPLKLLAPLLAVLFGEPRRRRQAAATLLQRRGSDLFARARLGWAWRRAGGRRSAVAAAAKTVSLFAQEAAALLLSIPFKILGKVVFTAMRAVNRLRKPKGLVEKARLAQPQL